MVGKLTPEEVLADCGGGGGVGGDGKRRQGKVLERKGVGKCGRNVRAVHLQDLSVRNDYFVHLRGAKVAIGGADNRGRLLEG
jgi:hypothetical protein